MTRVGFIGLGSQGGPMARRIAESGFPLVLWARRAEALLPYADTKAEIAPSVSALGKHCDHVGICVLDDLATRQVCGELIPALRSGSRLAIHSTVHPNTVIDLAKQAAAHDVALIDAPVSGGGPAAAARSLTVMVGGDVAAIDAARPIFETFAGLIARVGDVGAGQMTKLVNNALMAAHVAMAHHGLEAAARLGLDRKAPSEIVKVSSGRSFGFDAYMRLPNPFAFDFGAKLLAKDVRLLGEVLGTDALFAPLRDIAVPFLEYVQRGASSK